MKINVEYIISLIDEKLEKLKNVKENSEENCDLKSLKDIIKKIDVHRKYEYTFIKELDENTVNYILNFALDDRKEEIKTTILFVKDLLNINDKVKVSKKQSKIIDEFIDIIELLINKAEYKLDYVKMQKRKDIKRFKGLRERLSDNKYLLIDDFEIIKDLDVSLVLIDKIIGFLNIYNINLYNSNNVEDVQSESDDIKEDIDKDNSINMDDLSLEIEELDSVISSIISENEKENELKQNNSEIDLNKEPILEKDDEIVETIEKEENLDDIDVREIEEVKEKEVVGVDIFNAQSFELEESSKKKKNIKSSNLIGNIEILKESLNDININYENLSSANKNLLLKITNIDEFNLIIKYIKEKRININENALCTVLSLSNSKTISSVYNLLLKYENVNNEYLDELINRMPIIFTNKGYSNLIKVLDVLKKYDGIDRENIILDNPIILVTDSDKVKFIVNIIEKFKLNINDMLKKKWIILINEYKINKNIAVLNAYNIDVSYIDKDSFILLLNDNLSLILDQFIELNMSDYIYEDPSLALRKIKTLIIKRIYYAYKNKLFVWKSPMLDNTYDSLISNNYQVLTNDEIKDLIKKYPKLEMIEEGNRLSLFSESEKIRAKRKVELIFNNKIISRIKTYSIFSLLTKNKVEEKEALLYSLFYNTYLEDYEMKEIKRYVDSLWRGDN